MNHNVFRPYRLILVVIVSCLWGMDTYAQTNVSALRTTPPVKTSEENASTDPGVRTKVSVTQLPYQIGTDDVLTISVWHETDLSRNVPVRPDGRISVPLVGDIQAAGKTALELQGELKLALSKYIKSPEVTVIVSDIRSRRVNVIGEVTRPGTFPLTQSMGVLDALAEAGGLRDFAKKKNIYVLRVMPDGTRQRLDYRYLDVLKGNHDSQEIMLQTHDTVVVP
jgi:polysaccharide export outer membrane protein